MLSRRSFQSGCGRLDLGPCRVPHLRSTLKKKDAEYGDHNHGRSLRRQLDPERQKEPAAEPAIPGHGAGRRHHPIDEAHRRPWTLDAREERDGRAQPLELAPALGAAVEVGSDLGPFRRAQSLVEKFGQLLARVVAVHGRKRSSLPLRSVRAR